MTLRRDWIASPNYSSRGGSSVRLVCCHTAEGALTYQSLGNYFASSSSGVSSHVGIDSTPGVIGEYVAPANKAWTQGDANPCAVSAELCAFAGWSSADWAAHPVILENAAAWVREECARFAIPIRSLSAAEAQGGVAGVCDHVDLGAWGGGHWDCGPSFPMAQVIAMATGGATSAPPAQRSGAMDIKKTSGGYYIFASDGGVFCFGDAQMYGSIPGLKPPVVLSSPIVGGAVTRSERGYWLAGADGGVFAFGDAQFDGSMGGKRMNAPVVGIEADPDGDGYWLLGQDGGVFAFDAPFYGSAQGHV